mmetsp:Transcript_31514/g.78540  ORF Transcript_31514/g.78540 Transcript_31514/m.78540 type:complete len:98 (+) Transcript_31514:134-427(+)
MLSRITGNVIKWEIFATSKLTLSRLNVKCSRQMPKNGDRLLVTKLPAHGAIASNRTIAPSAPRWFRAKHLYVGRQPVDRVSLVDLFKRGQSLRHVLL